MIGIYCHKCAPEAHSVAFAAVSEMMFDT
jgi:hypothetical protein